MWILRSQGALAMADKQPDSGYEKLLSAIDLAEILGMLPDAAHCHAMIADMCIQLEGSGATELESITRSSETRQSGDIDLKSHHRKLADEMYRSMGMFGSN